MGYRFVLVAAVFFAAAALAPASARPAEEKDAAAEAGATHETAIAPAKIPQSVLSAVNSPDRPAADKQLDSGRKPEQMLAFFGIKPGMKVADLWAGGGYTTELLARVVGPSGKKPGGIYGIIDNSAAAGSGVRDVSTLHRIDEAYVVNQIKSAGFVLRAASDALRNPKDDRTWLVFQHRGEQDRFMLSFLKPQGAGGVGKKSPK